jgi:hypothetical protein
MTFIHITEPSKLEHLLIRLAQGVFFNLYFLLYMISPKTAHRIVGYLEEEAVHSYTEYLAGVDNGTHANVPAPQIAIDYWKPGNSRPTQGCTRSSSQLAQMSFVTAKSITDWPMCWVDPVRYPQTFPSAANSQSG